jgi:hypothetical protein
MTIKENLPSMDKDGLKFFTNAISRSNCFLEYGCGGSTSYAANIAKVRNIISVDTSNIWIDNVKKSLSNKDTRLLISHCDLGEVGGWGQPINRDKSSDFWRYMVTPWQVANKHELIPDTVLIDGRFRVASFLYSLISARIGTLIMFDDYLNRDKYFIVEKFLKLEEKHGRMGVFYVEHNFTLPEIVSTIAEYSTKWS